MVFQSFNLWSHKTVFGKHHRSPYPCPAPLYVFNDEAAAEANPQLQRCSIPKYTGYEVVLDVWRRDRVRHLHRTEDINRGEAAGGRVPAGLEGRPQHVIGEKFAVLQRLRHEAGRPRFITFAHEAFASFKVFLAHCSARRTRSATRSSGSWFRSTSRSSRGWRGRPESTPPGSAFTATAAAVGVRIPAWSMGIAYRLFSEIMSGSGRMPRREAGTPYVPAGEYEIYRVRLDVGLRRDGSARLPTARLWSSVNSRQRLA